MTETSNNTIIEYLKSNNLILTTEIITGSAKVKSDNIAEKVKKDLIEAFEKSNQNYYCTQ